MPEYGEQAKFKTQEECEQAKAQKREEFRAQNKQIVATCNLSTKGWHTTEINIYCKLLLYEVTRKVFWTGVRIPPGPP